MPIVIKSSEDIQKMRAAGRVVAEAHALLADMVRPGITTGELDRAAHELIARAGGTPSFLNYHGYPRSICTSVGAEVVHGIPGERVLQEGEIVSIDVGVYLNGFHGDAADTYAVGHAGDELLALIGAARRSFAAGLMQARKGRRVGDVSAAVQSVIDEAGYGVVRGFGGHGVGRSMHEDPSVPNYGEPCTGARLQPGMTFAIEPMLALGDPEVVELEDGWTVVTRDGKPAAHFEHTVLITEGDPEILTCLT
jgi:methionyl aminopeptidase